jgi:hypothetical protein
MKKTLLLGTTALIAAGVITTGAAQAEDPISAGISGYFRTAMAVISQDDLTGELAAGNSSHTLANDIEITVSGSTTLDNGITAGFKANIEGNGGDALDERFVFFRGSFGQIRVGQTESARQELSNNTPTGNWNFGINSPFFSFGTNGGVAFIRTSSDGLGDEDSLKLVYFSPTFNGLRLAASYAPTGNENDAYPDFGGGGARDGAGATQNEAGFGVELSQNLGDFSLRVSAGYEAYVVGQCAATAATVACDSSPATVQFGGTITMGEWSIGGEWMQSDLILNSADGSGNEREDVALGIGYGSGPLSASLNWGQAEVDQATDDTDKLEIIRAMLDYVIGPGISIGAGVAFGDFDDATPGAADNSYTTGVITAAVSF